MPTDKRNTNVASTKPKRPPGPTGNALLGSAGAFLADQIGFLLGLQRDFGDVVSFRIGPTKALALFHPDHIKYVCADNAANYGKPERLKAAAVSVLGKGLLVSDGDFWRRQRRIAQPVFHKKRLAVFAKTMSQYGRDIVAELRDQSRDGALIDATVPLQKVTERIAGKILFGIDLAAGENEAVARAVKTVIAHVFERIGSALPLPEFLPTPGNRRFHRAVELLDGVVYGAIAGHRAHPEAYDDLLSMLIEARDEETGEGMSDQHLRDEVLSFYGAGQDTTAVAMSWLLGVLSQQPPLQRQLREEALRVLGNADPDSETIGKLELTMRVVNEVMRLYPPAPFVPRTALSDDEIGGYSVPKGTMIVLYSYVTHRDRRFWDHPEGFDPDHFKPEKVKQRPRYAYFPFGGGEHQCIGMGFALMQISILLPMILRAFHVQLNPGARVDPAPTGTLQIKGGVPVRLLPV